MNITKRPTYARYSMNRAVRLIIADLFAGAEKFTIIRNSNGTASIGMKCGKAYLTAFDYIYHEKRRSIEKIIENAVNLGRIEKRKAAKTCAFLKSHLFVSTNYARAAFFASVLSRIVFGNSETGICDGIRNLAKNGAENFAETRRAELEEYHKFIMSHDYAAMWHEKRANHFRMNSEMMAKKAEAHEHEAEEYRNSVSNDDFGDDSFLN